MDRNPSPIKKIPAAIPAPCAVELNSETNSGVRITTINKPMVERMVGFVMKRLKIDLNIANVLETIGTCIGGQNLHQPDL